MNGPVWFGWVSAMMLLPIGVILGWIFRTVAGRLDGERPRRPSLLQAHPELFATVPDPYPSTVVSFRVYPEPVLPPLRYVDPFPVVGGAARGAVDGQVLRELPR